MGLGCRLRMPHEWNQVMIDLIRQKNSWPIAHNECYRSATSDKVLEPNEFCILNEKDS